MLTLEFLQCNLENLDKPDEPEMVGQNESKLPNLKSRCLVPVKVTSLPANPFLTEKVSFPKANKIEISLHPLCSFNNFSLSVLGLIIYRQMRQAPLECDINIALNVCSGFATSTKKGPFTQQCCSRALEAFTSLRNALF